MVNGQTVSESILVEAETIWNGSKVKYRDAQIRVGNLLCEFVLARLKESEGMNEAQRREAGLTREKSMKYAAKRLDVTRPMAYGIVRIAKTVEVFGDPGELSYSTLRVFSIFVQHKKSKVARGLRKKEGEVTPLESEKWEIKGNIVSKRSPQEIYNKAVSEKWTAKQTYKVVCEEVKVFRRGGSGPSAAVKELDRDSVTGLPSLQELGRTTHPTDLVDMIFEMVESCPRKNELKKLLIERIN